jgi:hypothetical protein
MLWRRLRAAGASGLQNGVWVLPYSSEQEKLAQDLQTYVEQQGGSSQVFIATPANPSTAARVLELFKTDRTQEYYEFKEQCQVFLADITKEIENENYSYAEFEENEQNLNKLVGWLAKIKQRDFFGGEQGVEADALLESCRTALLEFADRVYRSEGSGLPVNPFQPDENTASSNDPTQD